MTENKEHLGHNISSRCTTSGFLTGFHVDSEKRIACLKGFFESGFFIGFFSFGQFGALNRAGKTKEMPI